MARYGCTITVAAGKAPSSQSNVAWVATEDNFPSAAIDGGSTSILNGGGNLRCYTDSTKATQIPIEVVAFVTGVSPSVVVWGLSPTIDVGSTVYIEADTVATAQPAASSTYGSESVWVDYIRQFHGNDLKVDSSGNIADGTFVGTESTGSDSVGVYTNFDGATNYVTQSAIGTQTSTTISALVEVTPNSDNKQIFAHGDFSTSSRLYLTFDASEDFATRLGTTTKTSSTTLTSPIHVAAVINSGNVTHFVNGSKIGTASSYTGDAGSSSSNMTAIGAFYNSTSAPVSNGHFSGKIYNLGFESGVVSDDAINIQSQNQSDPSTFWTTSAWEDQDAGGSIEITLSESGPAFTESISATISANISTTITESGPSFTESINTEVSSLTISASISEQGPSFTESIEVDVQASTVLAASITESGPSFTESIEASILKTIESEITEQGPSFTESIAVTIPVTVAGNYKYITRVKNTHSSVRIRNNTNIKRVK